MTEKPTDNARLFNADSNDLLAFLQPANPDEVKNMEALDGQVHVGQRMRLERHGLIIELQVTAITRT